MRKFVDFMWRLKENGFFDSATQVLYYCYIWVTLLLCIIYMIDYILARQGKKTQPSMFVDKDMNNIRENQLAPLYRGVASVSAVNLLIAEGLRHLLLGLVWNFLHNTISLHSNGWGILFHQPSGFFDTRTSFT